MSNHYHPKRVTPDSAPMHIVLFRSRRKDNTDIEGFRQRCESFLTREPLISLESRFARFVHDGLPGEISRFYVSVNARDDAKVRTALLHMLIDEPDVDMASVGQMAVSVAARPANAAQHRWLFDVDDPDLLAVNLLIDSIHRIGQEAGVPNGVEVRRTPNGWHVICEHGFDLRRLHLPETTELKKDALTLHMCAANIGDPSQLNALQSFWMRDTPQRDRSGYGR